MMHLPTPRAPVRNLLIESLSPDDRALVSPHLSYVRLDGAQCTSTLSADRPVVCFPLTLVASVVQVMADGNRYEIGLIGSEGMIGWPITPLGIRPGLVATAQIGGGDALVLPSEQVTVLTMRSASFHAAMLAFVQSFAVQMSHTIVANLRDGIERRLARWLLMLHDRVDGDALTITHNDLAAALHVRRASVTDALHILEGEHVVRCTRGHIAVRDRAALAARAGDSYGPAEQSYRALVGEFGKS